MDAAFKRLEAALLRYYANKTIVDVLNNKPDNHEHVKEKSNGDADVEVKAEVEVGEEEVEDEASVAVQRHALELFYYWVNFAPLSRGTSATGYAALYGCILALGKELVGRVPPMKQLDWEGMFAPHPRDFVNRLLGWMKEKRKATLPSELLTYPVNLYKHKDNDKKQATDTPQDKEASTDFPAGSTGIKPSPRVGETFDSIARVMSVINVPQDIESDYD
jgi:hypothetical protein